MLKEVLISELASEIPEEIPMIRQYLKEGNAALSSVLFNKASSLMDPKLFVESIESGKVNDVLTISKKALKIRELALKVSVL
jgi:hypothetical protein